MATRKSKPATRHNYIALTVEDRLHQLEKRSTRNDLTRKWETSLTRRLAVSAAIYLSALLLLMALLVPGSVFTALIPVICYWLSLITLTMLRTVWDARTPDHRKG